MRITQQALIAAVCILLTGLSSCSRNATIPSQLSYSPIPTLTIPDSLFNEAKIDFAFYKVKPAQFFEQKLEIRNTFTEQEKKIVALRDGDVFARRQELILDLEALPEGAFAFPLPNARVISPFGKRGSRSHTGMDLKYSQRDTVVVAFDGIVRMAGWSRGYGNVVVVRHYNGLETIYAHNSKNLVRPGDQITAGTPILITGETGRATTEHVHFEVRVNGSAIDPALIIDFKKQSLLQKCLVLTPGTKGNIRVEHI